MAAILSSLGQHVKEMAEAIWLQMKLHRMIDEVFMIVSLALYETRRQKKIFLIYNYFVWDEKTENRIPL